MSSLKSFPFYIDEWIASSRSCSLESRGLLIDLLSLMHKHGGPIDTGKMPENVIARFAGVHPEIFDALLNQLIENGVMVRDGDLIYSPVAMKRMEARMNRSSALRKSWGARKAGEVSL